MTTLTLANLAQPIREAVLRTIEVFVEGGPKALAQRGLFPIDQVALAERWCGDYGGRFRLPPLGAPAYLYGGGNKLDIEVPLWLDGEDQRSDLVIFLEVDVGATYARVVDLYPP